MTGLIVLLLAITVTTIVSAAISLSGLNLPASFILKSEYYTIVDTVEKAEEEGFLKFKIASMHAPYEVEGMLEFQKTLREIEVIERIRRDEDGSGFFDGAADSVAATGEGFVKLVAHPIESIKGIGKAAGVLGRKIGGVFRKKEEGEKTSFSEKIMGGSERELAQKFGVDVYTRNPYMRELLHEMARARMGGKGAALIGKFLLPVAGLVSVTITASGVNSAADQLVNNKGKGDLYHSNEEALLELGFILPDVNEFLNNPNYSPREATYMRFYLDALKEISGVRDIFKRAREAGDFGEAHKILYAAQLAADYMNGSKEENISPDRRIEIFDEGIAFAEPHRLLFFTPYDYLDGSDLGNRVAKRVEGLKKSWQKSSVEIRNGGKITQDFTARMLLSGIKTHGWLLFTSTEQSEI